MVDVPMSEILHDYLTEANTRSRPTSRLWCASAAADRIEAGRLWQGMNDLVRRDGYSWAACCRDSLASSLSWLVLWRATNRAGQSGWRSPLPLTPRTPPSPGRPSHR